MMTMEEFRDHLLKVLFVEKGLREEDAEKQKQMSREEKVENNLLLINVSIKSHKDDVYELNVPDNYSKLRAGDGSVKFFIDSSLNHRSFVMLSKQMIKMNKGDKLSVKAYDAGETRILYNFTIFKKKFGLNVDLFLLTNDLYSNYGR